MAMNQIPGHNIYVGGILAVKNNAALTRANITHVVSVLRMLNVDDVFAPYQHHCIDVDDVDYDNILEHLPAAVKFIQSGLDAGGSVLVHCAMGKSRSATVCMAYLLRHQPALTPQSALELIREGRPLCEPNDGFMDQVSLYHEMGCPDDVTDHPIYQRWLYRREVEDSVACGRAPEMKTVLFEDEKQQKPQEEASDKTKEFKCRKCRRTLATSSFAIPHEKQAGAKAQGGECGHVFLHPLTWMRSSLFPNDSEEAPLSGRLTCPNTICGQNVGKFAWQGMRCSCGSWVTPAIGLTRARVDILDRVNTTRPTLAMGIRLPPGMRANNTDETGTGRGNL